MFKPDKEDGLFTLDSVFLLVKASDLLLVTFKDCSDEAKGIEV